MIDALTVRPLPGPFDPYEPSTDDALLIQRASERAAAAYCAAHQAARHADTTLDRAAQILGRIVAAANVLDRHEQNRSCAYSRLYQTITNLDRTAERTNHRLPGHYQSPQTTRQGDDRHRGPLTADHDRPYRRSPGRPR